MTEISLIVPTFNRAKQLSDLIESLSKLENDFELIIVDDKSTDHTEAVVRSSEIGEYVKNDGDGRLDARITGLNNASGEIIGFLEDDMEVKKNFLQPIIELFGSEYVNVAQTRIIDRHNNKKIINKDVNPAEYKWNFEHESRFHYGLNRKRITFVQESGFFIREKILDDVHLIDKNLVGGGYGESLSFSFRLKNEGYNIHYVPESIINHFGCDTGGAVEQDAKIRGKNSGCSPFFYEFYYNMMYIHTVFFTAWSLPALLYHTVKSFGRVIKYRDISYLNYCLTGLCFGFLIGLREKLSA